MSRKITMLTFVKFDSRNYFFIKLKAKKLRLDLSAKFIQTLEED
jgi:hypothetical protein